MSTTEEQRTEPSEQEWQEAWELWRSMAGMLHDSYERRGGVERVIADLDADEIVP